MCRVPPDILANSTARLNASSAVGESSAPTTTTLYMLSPVGDGPAGMARVGRSVACSVGLDDEDGAARTVGDRVRHAPEDPALHPLGADDDEVGPDPVGHRR